MSLTFTRRPARGLPAIVLGTALALVLGAVVVGPASALTGSAFDGDPATTERVRAGDPVTAAIAVSQQRFDAAEYVVLATDAGFADSLAGAALTDRGPLLLTAADALTPSTAAELDRVLAPGGRVFVLGGTEAISRAVVDSLADDGFAVTRLAGETRVQTALAVADEVRRLHPSSTVLLARSDAPVDNPTSAWADSMTGGALAAAAGIPIVVTPTAGLHPDVEAWLGTIPSVSVVLLGGRAALSTGVADAVGGIAATTSRLSGPERTATAAAIAASALWPVDVPGRYVVLDGGRADGWAYGLSAAGIAADAGAPPLLVVGQVTAATRRLVSSCGAPAVDLLLMGDESVISQDVLDQLTVLDGQSCASSRTALRQFDDCAQTLAYFVDEGLQRVGPYGLDGYFYGAYPAVSIEEDAAAEGAPPPSAEAPSAPAASGGDGDTPADVSGTNTQEVGVDEPDRVKAPAEALYITGSGPGVEVMALTPGNPPEHAVTLDIDGAGYGSELLLAGDVLLVLSRGDDFAYPAEAPPPGTSFAPPQSYPEPTTRLTRFDISQPTSPVLLDSAEIRGDYRSARMVDGVARVVTSANPHGLAFTFPAEQTDQAHAAALAHNRSVIEDSVISDWLPTLTDSSGESLAVPCDAVFTPPEFSGISTALVTSFHMDRPLAPSSAAAVVAQAETLYASTERLVLSSSQYGEWTPDAPPPSVTTAVHSFDIADPERTAYVGSGEVEGYVLNSFAISERDGYYRIATTTDPPWTEQAEEPVTDNGITILTEGGTELFKVGRVTGLGLGERIFAVRYLGDVAVVVTFRQVDPLYLVDLTNPAAPVVTGELKIPGVSRYLHPLDDGHLLGVGQDGDAEGRLTGLQVSLFDITDRSAPTRVDAVQLGEGYSPVEFDHKAFLLWAALGRAFVPASLYEAGTYGVQVIDIDTAAGVLTQSGNLAHPDGGEHGADRTVVVGDTVYAVGYDGVTAHDLRTLALLGVGAFPS